MLSICIYVYIAIVVVALISEIFSKDKVVGHLTNTKLYKECDNKILAYISLILSFIFGSPLILLYHLCVVLEYLFTREERLNIDTSIDVKTLITEYNKLFESPEEKKKEELDTVQWNGWNGFARGLRVAEPERKDYLDSWKKMYEDKCKELVELGLITIVHNSKGKKK